MLSECKYLYFRSSKEYDIAATRRLLVNGLQSDLDDEVLIEKIKSTFNPVGEIVYVDLREEQQCPGKFAFIDFTSVSSVVKAMEVDLKEVSTMKFIVRYLLKIVFSIKKMLKMNQNYLHRRSAKHKILFTCLFYLKSVVTKPCYLL